MESRLSRGGCLSFILQISSKCRSKNPKILWTSFMEVPKEGEGFEWEIDCAAPTDYEATTTTKIDFRSSFSTQCILTKQRSRGRMSRLAAAVVSCLQGRRMEANLRR